MNNEAFTNGERRDGSVGYSICINDLRDKPVPEAIDALKNKICSALDEIKRLEWGSAQLTDITILRSISPSDTYGDFLTLKLRAKV